MWTFLAATFGGLVAGITKDTLNTWYERVYIPSQIPLNVEVTLAVQAPKSKHNNEAVETTTGGKNNAETKPSPLNIDITIKNPGNKILYLKQSFWQAEACYIRTDSQDKNKQTEDFTKHVSDNQKLKSPTQFQFYNGYYRNCKFIGVGRLLTDDNIKPQEVINAKVILVYPTAFEDPSGNNTVPTDFVRVRTFVPSILQDDPKIDTAFVITYKKLVGKNFQDAEESEVGKAGVIANPGGIQWVDISHCPSNPSDHPQPCQKIPKNIEGSDSRKEGAQFTVSTSEIWVGD
jgi:hypothetical protein